MDSEEMERELWELRSAAIDRDMLRQALDTAVSERDLAVEASKKALADNERFKKDIAQQAEQTRSLREAVKEAEIQVEKLLKDIDAQKKTISRLYKELGNQAYQDHLAETYQFEVAKQMPGSVERQAGQRRNWRLSQ